VEAKWSELQDYERGLNSIEDHQPAASAVPTPPLTTRQKFIQFKKQSSRRFFNIKNQLAGKYRRADEDDGPSEVSSSPTGGAEADPRVACAPSMRSIGSVGRGIKSSKSL